MENEKKAGDGSKCRRHSTRCGERQRQGGYGGGADNGSGAATNGGSGGGSRERAAAAGGGLAGRGEEAAGTAVPAGSGMQASLQLSFNWGRFCNMLGPCT